MSKKSLRGKLVGLLRAKANGKATPAQNESPNPNPEPVVPDNPDPVYLTRSRRYWSSGPNPGECEVSVELDHWEEENDPFVILEMRWNGECDSPEWKIRWVHYLDYLGYYLPGYLRAYSPGPPEQMLYQLVSGLEYKYACHFESGVFAEWKARVERENKSTESE